jgi:hypothetical protein
VYADKTCFCAVYVYADKTCFCAVYVYADTNYTFNLLVLNIKQQIKVSQPLFQSVASFSSF